MFVTLDTSTGGAADGSTVDAEGFLWNAQVYDWASVASKNPALPVKP